MTIAVGVLCEDGVVVGADREVSLSSFKVEDRKAHLLKRNNVRIGLVGSGPADLVTLAAQELDNRLVPEMSMEAVKTAVDDLAQDIHAKHVLTNPDKNYKLDLLLAVKTTPNGAARKVGLLRVNGTIVVWKDRYDAIGWGYELAHYLLSQLYDQPKTLSMARGIMLAAQVLKAAKDYTQGCGGPSDIIQVRLGYVSDFVHEDDVRLHEESAEKFAKIMRPVMLAMTDVNVDSKQLGEIVGKMQVELHTFRSNEFIQRQKELSAKLRQGESASGVSGDTSSSVSAAFGTFETSAPSSVWSKLDKS
jgi:20S proteasome alpha/beta subunit